MLVPGQSQQFLVDHPLRRGCFEASSHCVLNEECYHIVLNLLKQILPMHDTSYVAEMKSS